MNFFSRKTAALVAAALVIAIPLSQLVAKKRYGGSGKAGVFDYYSLVLSWSPTFCDSNAGRRARQQCGRGRQYAFVVHGLWPQHNKGWPQNCRVKKGEYWLDRKVIDSMTDIMPSRKLIIHEWKKHGTCSGLSGRDYYNVTRQLYNKIKIPARYVRPNNYITTSPQELEADFLKANKWLDKRMVSVHCGRKRRLKELRFCFGKDLKPRPCGSNENRECRSNTLALPPVR